MCSFLTACGLGMECENRVLEEIPSPDRSKKIVLFSRECGATIGINTQATLLNSNENLPDESGNVFIIDDGSAKVAWKDDSTVLVIFTGGPRNFKRETEVKGVRIQYH
ncbi:MAG: hypothetical protein R3F19_23465 [Verrucomicrobiales bacterium]